MSNETLAAYIEKRRQELGNIPRSKVESDGGLSSGWISKLERGRMNGRPKVTSLEKLAKGLQAPVAEVMEAAGYRPERSTPKVAMVLTGLPVDIEEDVEGMQRMAKRMNLEPVGPYSLRGWPGYPSVDEVYERLKSGEIGAIMVPEWGELGCATIQGRSLAGFLDRKGIPVILSNVHRPNRADAHLYGLGTPPPEAR